MSVSVPIKGMNQDDHIFNISTDNYSFALNAVIENYWQGDSLFISNEPSTLCNTQFPIGYQVVGYVEIIEQERTIYFLHNPTTGFSQIGETYNCDIKTGTDKIINSLCDNCDYYGEEITPLENTKEQCICQYKIITSSNCLNFNINHRVDIEYKLTNCSLNLYFTDNINERRFIYFDYKDNDFSKELILQDRFKIITGYSDTDCKVPIYENELDCEKIKFHPNYSRPCPKFISFVNGGNLKAGTYQILVSYADVYGNPISQYFPSTQIVPLFEKEITFDTDYQTSQALHFEVNNLSNNSIFKYYNIVIAQTIESFTEFIHVATLPIHQKDYIYTGYEKSLKRLSPEEVLFKRPFYQYAKNITKANNYLFFSNVKEYRLLNLQPVANQIKLQWETIAIKEGEYKKAETTFNYRTYQRDEVYSVGIIFEYNNGRETEAFHIPGRAPNTSDLNPITLNNDVLLDLSCEPIFSCNRSTDNNKKAWEVYNTATVIGTPHEYTENCKEPKTWEYGNFSFWESTEKYPNVPEVWGDLCGTCIRHHKFPDNCISHIHDSKDGNKSFSDNNYIFPIGIKVDNQSVITALDNAVQTGLITQEERNSIVSYRIVRGNRVGQKSVIAKGLLYNILQDNSKDTGIEYFPNYPYNDLRISNNGDSLLEQVGRDNNTRFTFHSPDIHFVNSAIGSILKIETEEYGQSEGYFTNSECQAKQKLVSQFVYVLSLGLGLAAALSATGEKMCKTIIKRADVFIEDNEAYPNITGTWNAVLTPAGGTHTGNINTTGQTITTNDKEEHNNENYTTYDNETGVVDGTVEASEEHITTCKGQSFQLFNSNIAILTLIGGANQIVQRTILAIVEQGKVLDTIKSLLTNFNLSAQYNSVGKYNNYKCVPVGNRVRKIKKGAYLTPHTQYIDVPSNDVNIYNTIKINNWDRESSVYLNIDNSISDPVITDNSKTSMREQFGTTVTYKDVLDKRFNRTISSYYGSIKNPIYNQYGSICNINYLETNGCSFSLNSIDRNLIFGGDTFINRFAIKRKLPLFLRTNCKLPDNSDILYSELENVGKPRYWFDTPEPLLARIMGTSWSDFDIYNLFTVLTTENDKQYDISSKNLFQQKGLISLYHYGIPYFIVESDINVDYRTGQNTKDKDFYPHNTNLKEWLEEENVPITTDNTFYYNKTYSKQNNESIIATSCILDKKDLICQSTNYSRLIYSETFDTENKEDNWLVFKANNYYDFDLTKGKLISVDGIENSKVFVRLEKGSQVFNAFDVIQASGVNIQVGTGGMFKTRPQDVAVTDLGYAGTQHQDMLHTEFGHIWADAERGQVFILKTGGEGIDEISNIKMKSWFREHLPFKINKYFKNIDIDNNLNGIGLHYGYDRRFNRFLITKLDYIPLNNKIIYNDGKFYLDDKEVLLSNPKLFCNKSWTLSYNFFTKSWVSYHTYRPLFYVEHINTFDSSIKDIAVLDGLLTHIQKVYTHNATNKSYQVIYGKLEPFIIEAIENTKGINNNLYSIDFQCEAVRFHNDYDYFYNRTKTFNKVIIYNDRQSSGVLNLTISNPNDFSESFKYPFIDEKGLNILTTNSENTWRINTFYNVVKNELNNIPIFLNDCNNVNKQLNSKAISYHVNDLDKELLKGKHFKIRYIQDKESNYRFTFILSANNTKQSFR